MGDGYIGPVMLEIDRIDVRPASTIRAARDEEAIESYVENFDRLPPLKVIADADDRHWLVDGYHRHCSALRLGKTLVACLIKRGTFIDAFGEAARVNDEHGVRVTNADKRHRVKMALKLPEMLDKPQGVIGALCGVSQQYVSKLDNRPVHNNGELGGKPLRRVGKDGKMYPATRPKRRKAEAPVEPTPDPGPAPEPPPARPRRKKADVIPEPEPEPGLFSEPPLAPPRVVERFRAVNEFDAVANAIHLAYSQWPEEHRGDFAMMLGMLAARLCSENDVTFENVNIREVNRGA